MKLIKSAIDARTQTGSVTLLPTTPEDMWSAYNLLHAGDRLRASAIRRVVTETSSTGSSTSQRVHTTLTLAITSLDFDARASQLHVSGRVAAENAFVKLGQYHTLDLELNRNFTLEKGVADGGGGGGGGASSGWDSVAIATLREACKDDAAKAEVWALLIEEGLANLFVVGDGTTVLRQTVAVRLGSKDSPGYASALQKFYRRALDTLVRALDFSDLKPVLVAGVGWTGQKFVAFVRDAAAQSSGGKGRSGQGKELKLLLEKIVLERAGSAASSAALAQVLASPGVQKRLADTKFARESALLDALFARMRVDDGRVAYGATEVERAVDAGAVGKGGGVLLLSDELFRSNEIGVRKKWVALVDRVRDREGGEVRIVSSMHESGARLKGVGDVAALLTFPIFEVEEDDDPSRAEGRPTDDGDEDAKPRPWRPADDGLPEIEM